MKKFLSGLGALFLLILLYLFLWPVPVAPEKWDAPENQGYIGDFVPNDRLASLQQMPLDGYHGPEDLAVHDGMLYVTSQDGVILRMSPLGSDTTVVANTGGKPLGIEALDDGTLIVADAYKGLLSITQDGQVTVLTDKIGDSPILYADDLDIADNGVIYFSDASVKFGAEASGDTMEASRLEILEQGNTGRVLSYDPATGETELVADGFTFSNGVAWAGRDANSVGSILVNETGKYRVLRIYTDGPRKGEYDVVIDNLPGFPDNINPGSDGTFWLGLVSQRSDFLDKASNKPWLRKLALRLPRFMQPEAVDYGFVVQIDADGKVLQTLQDPEGKYPLTTGAIEGPDGRLYITSLGATTLARKTLND